MLDCDRGGCGVLMGHAMALGVWLMRLCAIYARCSSALRWGAGPSRIKCDAVARARASVLCARPKNRAEVLSSRCSRPRRRLFCTRVAAQMCIYIIHPNHMTNFSTFRRRLRKRWHVAIDAVDADDADDVLERAEHDKHDSSTTALTRKVTQRQHEATPPTLTQNTLLSRRVCTVCVCDAPTQRLFCDINKPAQIAQHNVDDDDDDVHHSHHMRVLSQHDSTTQTNYYARLA